MNAVYTIGTSDIPLDQFLLSLGNARRATVLDLRSFPNSKRNPWCGIQFLPKALADAGVGYRHLGRLLGGRPSDPALMTDGAADYRKMAASPLFRRGLDVIRETAGIRPVVLMCSEEDPIRCHRMVLVCRHLRMEMQVLHIRGDGSLEPNWEAESRMERSAEKAAGRTFGADIEAGRTSRRLTTARD